MRRSVALPIGIVVAFLILVLALTQALLPVLAASRIEHRLTKGGGSAHVSVHAFPALRLLFHHGDSIRVTGSGLNVPLGTGKAHVLKNLDGFHSARIQLTDVTAGPFHTNVFTLDKPSGSSTYELVLRASFTPARLASYFGSAFGGSLGGLLGGLAGGFAAGTQPVPVAVDAQLVSEGGNPRVVSGAGTVAGIPMGPVLEAVTAAVIARM
ncbi:MAG TPA: hypothetical protein VJU60_13195 [Thermoleophilaceae bacterium]|nr:hypothetical protein [Thermoleophilaceae bacterium]